MVKTKKKITVAIADDHNLLRTALARLVNSFDEYSVVLEAGNGKELKLKLQQQVVPDIVMLDVNMPEMDGFETAQWLNKTYPQIKILALSMLSDEKTIIKMFRVGAKGYLLKNTDPEELRLALKTLIEKNYYLSDYVSEKLVSGLNVTDTKEEAEIVLNEKEREFLRLTCSELSYKDIAAQMFFSARTIDDLRSSLFVKLKVHSRVGLVMYAIRNGIAEV
ncbi:MAG: response regulator transcription factor [Chitinophagaceae bacterium]|nr:response regulator transcription factor [Chitinophagaceae bacterium]